MGESNFVVVVVGDIVVVDFGLVGRMLADLGTSTQFQRRSLASTRP